MTSNLNYKSTLQLVNMAYGGPANQADTTAQNPIGCVTRYNGNLYRYVQFSTGTGTVASVAGAPCWYYPNTTDSLLQTDLNNNTLRVTSDYSAGVGVFAGVLLSAAITTLSYIWILVGGVANIVVNDDTTVKGDRVYATSDATFTRLAQGAATWYNIAAVLLEDRSHTTTGIAKALIYPKQIW